jgi:hypothetical protein
MRRKNRQRRRHVRPKVRLNGFDFGIDQFFMLVSDFHFNNLLHDASIGGCAYGLSHSNEVRGTVPTISLGARKIEPLKRAFEILSSWDRRPGDDGFNLEFILLKSGGYLITISPEFEALRNRIARSDRFFAPLGVNVSWIFELSSQGPWIPQFRKYVDRPISPFIFTGCEFISADKPVRHLPDVPEVLKFQAQFSDEAEGTLSSFASAILERRGRQRDVRERGPLPSRPKQTPHEIRDRRAEQLRRHFPVTTYRLSNMGGFEEFRTRNPGLNVSDWQYQQAYCNVALSTAITGRPQRSPQ